MPLERALFTTNYGSAYAGDSLELLDQLEPESINLVLTSPPFALHREKSYGNVDQRDYIVYWIQEFRQKRALRKIQKGA